MRKAPHAARKNSMLRRKSKDANLARRSRARFCIDLELRYTLLQGNRLGRYEAGRTLNISSAGVWLTTENILGVGSRVELSMNWPVLINDVCPMKLMVYGRVVAVTLTAQRWPSSATNSARRPRRRCLSTAKPPSGFGCNTASPPGISVGLTETRFRAGASLSDLDGLCGMPTYG